MDDKTLQKKLDQLAGLADELDAEAKRRYGPSGNLFFESGGSFYIMDDDEDSGSYARQTHVQFSSKFCRMGCGSW